jgi:dienelactone hydrolase
MRFWARACQHLGLAIGCLAIPAPTPASAEPPRLRPEIMAAHQFLAEYRETLLSLPITVRTIGDRPLKTEFQLTHFRPAGDGPFPVAILQHGRSPDRSTPSRYRGGRMTNYFLRRGFAVFVPTRVGFGGLGVRVDPENWQRPCADNWLEPQMTSVATHARATLDYAKTLPWIDQTRVILAGQSVGGYTSLTTAARGMPGIIGVVNLAGGSGARAKAPRGEPGCADYMPKYFRDAGKTLRVPTLWVYAENDQYWGTKHPRIWHKAFIDAGGKAEFVSAGKIEGDGHSELTNTIHAWRPPTDAFLTKIGFPSRTSPKAPPKTNFARLDDVTKLPSTLPGAIRAYQQFLLADVPRAFVIAPNGLWISNTNDPQSLDQAMRRCTALSNLACKPYAVDDAIVWVP